MTQDGDMIIWKGSGVGKFKEKGALSYRGILLLSDNFPKVGALEQRGRRF